MPILLQIEQILNKLDRVFKSQKMGGQTLSVRPIGTELEILLYILLLKHNLQLQF